MKRFGTRYISILVLGITAFGTVNNGRANAQEVFISAAKLDSVFEVKLTRQLDFGMTGDEVKLLQVFLSTMPDVYPGGFITGYFGAHTENAVKKFQKKYGLAAVGRVGPNTLAKISEIVSSSSMPVIFGVSSENLSANVVRVKWLTEYPATTELIYSKSPEFSKGEETRVMANKFLSKSHIVDLHHLDSGSAYNFIIMSASASGSATATARITHVTSNR